VPVMSPTPRENDTTERVEVPLPRETSRELWLLVGVFLSARLMSIWWFQPLHSEVGTFYFPFAWLQGRGVFPFLHYWFEHPPLLAYLVVALRYLSLALCGAGDVAWERLCLVRTTQVASVVWELASLHLLYAMAKVLRGPKAATRACWVYVALFSTGFVSLSFLETFPVFLMLASLYLAFYSKPAWSALVLAGGFMAKMLPVGILPAILKCDARWRWRFLSLVVFLGGVAAVAAPFLGAGRRWLLLSFECAAKRPPWTTAWALLDRRYDFGYVGPGAKDQTPDFFAERSGFGVVPWAREVLEGVPREVFGPPGMNRLVFYHIAAHFATNLAFLDSRPRTGETFLWVYGGVGVALGVFYLLTFARMPSALPPRRRLFLGAFTMFLVFFYAKGWSPQFVLYLVPLLLIAFPLGEGGLWSLAFTILVFLEMPVWVVYVHGRPDLLMADQLLLHGITIARTALLLIVAARLYPRLFND